MIRVIFLVLYASCFAFAQTGAYRQRWQIWEGDRSLAFDAKGKVARVVDRGRLTVRPVRGMPGHGGDEMSCFYAHGEWVGWTKITPWVGPDQKLDKDNRFGIYRSKDGQTWEPDGLYVQDPKSPQHGKLQVVIPLPDGRLFALGHCDQGWVKGRATHPYVILRSHQGRWLVDEYGDPCLGEEDPWMPKGGIRCPALMDLHFVPIVSFFEGGFVLGSRNRGRFLVFDERGRFRRKVDLFPLDKEDLRAPMTMDRMVVETATRKDGILVIATRDVEKLRPLWRRHQEVLWPPMKLWADKGIRAKQDRLYQEMTEQAGELQWWMLDPATGNTWRTSAPNGLPTRIPSLDWLKTFTFTIDARNNLRVDRLMP